MLCYYSGRYIDLNSTMVTASTPIVVSINHHDSVAAVVGLRMQYRNFYELFMDSTRLCDEDKAVPCNFTCYSDVSLSSATLFFLRSFIPNQISLSKPSHPETHFFPFAFKCNVTLRVITGSKLSYYSACYC